MAKPKLSSFLFFQQVILLVVLLSACVQVTPAGEEILVSNQSDFNDAVKSAVPGSVIVLQNGVWKDFQMVFEASGTKEKPITLTVEKKGEVIISGKSNLRIAGEHLIVSGLVFKDGYTPTKEVISFRTSKSKLANHTRVTEVVIDHFNNPERHERDYWVMMYGKHNRFDHNHLVGKSNAGVTMAVRLDSKGSQENYHQIDHNYFGPRQVLGSNGGETLRIGTSKYSLTDSFTLVENNYFERCNGEVEIVSSKSGNNTFRGNVFYESQGTLTLRHGNDNLVENNIFLGNGVAHTGGFRVINKRQTIRNNYMHGLRGYRFGGALVIMNGVPNSPINRYHQVEDSLIENNTIIDSDHIEFAAGADSERSAPPINTVFKNNLIVNRELKNSIGVHDDISGIDFAGNIASGISQLPAVDGFEQQSLSLEKSDNGLEYPKDSEYGHVGVSKQLNILDRNLTGVAWYPKDDNQDKFNGDSKIVVKPGQDTLVGAVNKAQSGDTLLLVPGEYQVTKIIQLDKALTISGLQNGQINSRPTIKFERTTLFELIQGGNLKLVDIKVDASESPDTYGNSVIRTSRYSMLPNYEIHVDNSEFVNLNVNHSFYFIKVASHTFADKIIIKNSSFNDVSGHIVALDREIDDLGIYNAEYLTIKNSTFSNVGGALANVYRGGTDESTFGPHVDIHSNILKNVGNNKKRNKTKSSIFLLGSQVTGIMKNKFIDSAPVTIVQTVGDPITTVQDNTLQNTLPAQITDYVYE